jgi:hypothetical protein
MRRDRNPETKEDSSTSVDDSLLTENIIEQQDSLQNNPTPPVQPLPAEEAEERKSFELRLAAGERIHPNELAAVTTDLSEEEARDLKTVGLTFPSVNLQIGVTSSGDLVDERADLAAKFREAVMTGKVPEGLEMASGLTVSRFLESTHGIPSEGHEEDLRRLVLSDTPEDAGKGGQVGGVVFTKTVMEEAPKSPTENKDSGGDGQADQPAT